MTAIFKKELKAYFDSLMGFVFLVILVCLTGVYFALTNVSPASGHFEYVLNGTLIFYLLLTPIITMRLFAEEAKQKTDQLIFTAPLTVTSVVIGKFLAAVALVIIGAAITALFPLMISGFGVMPTGQIVSAYIGYILVVSCFTAIGAFVSSLTDNQIIAAVITFAALLVMFLLDSITGVIPTSTGASMIFVLILIALVGWIIYDSTKSRAAGICFAAVGAAAAIVCFIVNNLMYDGLIIKFIQWFSVVTRFRNFASGVFNVSDVVYYLTFAAAFIYLSVNVIEKRRWK